MPIIIGYGCRNEKLLGEGLELNDSLQSLLAKHEAIAAGTLLLPAASKSHILEKKPIEPPVVSNVSEDEDNFDDDFAQLARRFTGTLNLFAAEQFYCC